MGKKHKELIEKKKLVDDKILLTALRCQSVTIEALKEKGIDEPVLFLATYIKTGNKELFTERECVRETIVKLNRSILKKELLIMLYLEIQNERNWSNVRDNAIYILFQKLELDSSDYEVAFDYLVDNYPKEFNFFITDKIKEFFFLRNYSDKTIANKKDLLENRIDDGGEDRDNPLYNNYFGYSKRNLNAVDNFRKGKKRLKVDSIQKVEEYLKKLLFI